MNMVFKDKNGAIHELPEGFEYLLPVELECKPITQEEADAIRANEAQPKLTLAERKVLKNTEINNARLAANKGTFTHAGKVFACDDLSRGDIESTNGIVILFGALPAGWPGGWKAVDNTYTAIVDVAAWKAFYASMYAAGIANFVKAQTLKAQLAAATTAKQVNAINW